MPLKLIVGPPNSGRAGEVRRRLLERAADEPVLVVPTGDDAAWFERELCGSAGPVLGVSIRTFAWLFEDVARSVGVEHAPLLSGPQRLALVRAAIASTPLRRLGRSSTRAGFAPALDALIAELQAALVSPEDLRLAASGLDDGRHEQELALLYEAYEELRRRAGRSDGGSLAAGALAALRRDPDGWGGRPVFLYGFGDLTRAQLELVGELSRAGEVTVALDYAHRRSLAANATLLAQLREEMDGETIAELEADPGYTARETLRHLDRGLFEPDAGTVEPDGGLVLMECAGERGEAEAIGLEIARLLDAGSDPGDIAVVLRRPSVTGPVLAQVLSGYGIPVAVEADTPLDRTSVGRALTMLCRAASPGGKAEHLLAHLRADPTVVAGIADRVERRIRRGEARSPEDAYEGWAAPPRHLARLRAAEGPAARLRALAEIGHEVAEGADAGQAPLEVDSVELRAASAAAELLDELAAAGELPGCEPPDLLAAAEALEGASVPLWRGPTEGRVRILSPYRLRAGRADYVFCASLQDGGFPAGADPDPLLGDDRRAALGIPALRRRDPAEQERYLFGACVSRPTERLYLSWRSCDDEGQALARSSFVDEVLDLMAPSPAAAEERLVRTRGIERVVPAPAEAPSERELARALAARGAGGEHDVALRALQLPDEVAARVSASLAAIPDPDALPGPLSVPVVLEELRSREALSAGSLERWLECPYRWFVEHELKPVRLEPESDPLWLGGAVHYALERLYAEAPGADAIPRPGDVDGWKARFAELLDEAALGPDSERRRPLPPARVAQLARAREQVESFLEDEAHAEIELRPRPDLVERSFGFEEEDEDDPGYYDVGDFKLRGRIDRIDVAPDGNGAVVRDYKTGSRVPKGDDFVDEGVLQIPLYMRVVRDRLGLDPIAGLYQPLGATGKRRRPRGLALKGDPRLEGLDLVRGGDLVEPDELEERLDDALERARRGGREMLAGDIGRRPLGGSCPDYCTFQPICRLERALGAEAEEDSENGE